MKINDENKFDSTNQDHSIIENTLDLIGYKNILFGGIVFGILFFISFWIYLIIELLLMMEL